MKHKVTINGIERTVQTDRERPSTFEIDGTPFTADVQEIRPGVYGVLVGEKNFLIRISNDGMYGSNGGNLIADVGMQRYEVSVQDPRKLRRGTRAAAVTDGRQSIKAPMPGKVVRVLVSDGMDVEAGQGLVVVEAMKMQNEIKSPKAGKVVALAVKEGQAVNSGELLLTIE